jgi:hypothetical protein
MKSLIKISALFASLLASIHAAEAQSYGFLNVVNLIPSSARCEIILAGKIVVPDGLKAGAETGWFMVPIGSHPISLKHRDHKTYSSDISITEGASNLIVIYLKSIERLQPDGKPFAPQIRFASIPTYASKGFALKAVSMVPHSSHFQLARETIELEFLKVTEIPKWTGGGFQIQYHGKIIGEVARGRERASYMLLLSSDHQGKYLTTIVNADPQKLPPWMQK